MVHPVSWTYNPTVLGMSWHPFRLDALPVCVSDDPCYSASTPGFPAEGIPIDCNRGEIRHPALKRTITSSCHRPSDIPRHLACKTNVALALKAVFKGLMNRAHVNPRAGWREEGVTPTKEYASVLDAVTHLRTRQVRGYGNDTRSRLRHATRTLQHGKET